MKGKIMIRVLVVIAVLMTISVCAESQFKSQIEKQPSVSQSLVHPGTGIGSFLGLLNPDNFLMRHNFSFSYLSSGGQGTSLASYTNSMFYKISDPLNVRFDVTLQGSPFGQSGALQQNKLNRLYISRAELNYKPMENMFIKIQYNQLPLNYFGRFNPYYSPLWGDE